MLSNLHATGSCYQSGGSGNIEAVLSLNTSLSPVCISCEQEPDYTYIVTPVRVVF